MRQRAAVLCLGAALVIVAWLPSAGATLKPHRALFVGDSLFWESQIAIGKGFSGQLDWSHAADTFPGSAPCDWLSGFQTVLKKKLPTVVAFETAGNSIYPCMDDPATGKPYVVGSDGWFARYETDLSQIFAETSAAHATIVYVVAPPMRDSTANAVLAQLTAWVEQQPDVIISTAPGLAVADSAGNYADRLPCLPKETAADGCSAGTIQVRNSDGVHFCPAPDGTSKCPVYSSGEIRFGKAAARAAIATG